MSGRLSRLYRGETDIDFLGRKKVWFALSGIVVVICAVTLVTKGLNFGIEFEGGVQTQVPVPDEGPLGGADDSEVIAEVEAALPPEATDAQIQVTTDSDGQRSVLVQSKAVADSEEQRQALSSAVSDTVGAEATGTQQVSGTWGEEITNKALRAFVIFLVVVLVFISLRFEWKMAIAAVVAMIHDLIITAGVYALVGFEVTPSSVIAILTILGYSLYDNVVVFDKVEENTELLAATGRMTYSDSANLAMNQVFMRSLNTQLASILPVAGLLFVGAGLLGADTLKDLSLALFVGLLVGTYSSIFVATPILVLWKEREPRYRNVRERLAREAQRAQARQAAVDVPSTEEKEEPRVPATVPSGPAGTPKAASRPRAGSKKAKRRRRR
jgi:preprotein translocase subunit SecF